jgi:hypothetical protein
MARISIVTATTSSDAIPADAAALAGDAEVLATSVVVVVRIEEATASGRAAAALPPISQESARLPRSAVSAPFSAASSERQNSRCNLPTSAASLFS